MNARAILLACLAGYATANAATSLWGTSVLLPFTTGEIAGAIVALWLVCCSARSRTGARRTDKIRVQPSMSSATQPASRPQTSDWQRESGPSAIRYCMARRKGQISPYFPGICAWVCSSFPPQPSLAPVSTYRVPTHDLDALNARLQVDSIVTRPFGLLPSYHPSCRVMPSRRPS
jgi:hypothetical protein